MPHVHVLNRGADAVMRAVQRSRAGRHGPLSVATAEPASLSDPEHQHRIDRDVDDALWDEMEAGLRHQGRVTPNFLALMALGGAVAAAGLVSHDPAGQVVASVAAATLAPGFEPIEGIARLGAAPLRDGEAGDRLHAGGLRRPRRRGGGRLLLRALGAADVATLAGSSAAETLAHPPATDLLMSVCGTFAGLVIQATYRRSVIAGALVAMRVIDAAAMVGAALAAGAHGLAWQALERLALDAALIVLAGLVVVWAKQRLAHRRAPIH